MTPLQAGLEARFSDSILHPTDFSEGSEQAFAHALALAVKSRAELTLLHAGTDDAHAIDWDDFPGIRETLERWGMLEAGSPRSAVPEKLGFQVRKVQTRSSDPMRSVDDHLEEFPTELVVLATHGREGLSRWLHRSAAERIARRTNTKTLFIPDGAEGFVSTDHGRIALRRVLLPVAGDPPPGRALAFMARAASLLDEDATLDIATLHVGDESTAPELEPPDGPRCTWRSLAQTGPVVDVILEIAAAERVDMIAMATHGHHGVLDAMRGSVTERVVRRAPCPVLAIPC